MSLLLIKSLVTWLLIIVNVLVVRLWMCCTESVRVWFIVLSCVVGFWCGTVGCREIMCLWCKPL